LLDRSDAATTPRTNKKTPLSVQIQSRALWRLRASLAETEGFSDVIRMEHFASSPEVPSSMASFESNAMPAVVSDWRAGLRADRDDAVRAPACQFDVTTPVAVPAAAPAVAVSARLAPSCSSETRRHAFRRAIAQRWTAARLDGDRRPYPPTSFDSMETDGDVSDTSCRPDTTPTSFDSTTTTTTTTTTDNTDDVKCGVQAAQSQHDSGYRSVEVRTSSPYNRRRTSLAYVLSTRSSAVAKRPHDASCH